MLVGVRLALEIFGSRCALRIHGQSDVKLRDVNLESQLRQTFNVGCDGIGIVVEAGKVQLHPYPSIGTRRFLKSLTMA